MDRIERNRRYLTALYEAQGPRLGLVYTPSITTGLEVPGDFAISDRPVSDWVPHYAAWYEKRMGLLDKVDDDAVPYVSLATTTGLFALSLGCEAHEYESGGAAVALPMVRTAEDLKKVPNPDINRAPLSRVLEMVRLLRARLGPEAVIGVPDMQSPFGIAALVWEKAEFLMALMMEPEAVTDLVEKCRVLFVDFLTELRRIAPNACMNHCPTFWVPAQFGCCLSEDEIGSIGPDQFAAFVKPALVSLGEIFGGLWIHCCADADHQHDELRQVPTLRGLNRAIKWSDINKTVATFGNRVVYSAGLNEEHASLLDAAQPDTRIILNVSSDTTDEANRIMDNLRRRMPRQCGSAGQPYRYAAAD